MRLVLALLGLTLTLPALAQPTAPLYDAAREAGASPTEAASLSAAARGGGSSLEAELVAADAAARGFFGHAVSISGDRALIGAPGDGTAWGGGGSAYVFVRSGDTWTQEAKITADDRRDDAFFGTSVSLSDDRVLIGAPSSTLGLDGAYVFVRSGTTWVQEAKLVTDDPFSAIDFGCSVSLSGDRALVGDRGALDNGTYSGAAYVFARSGTTWTLEMQLLAADGEAHDHFGFSVSLSGDRALVGAPDRVDGGVRAGAAYVFVRSGSTWTQEATLTVAPGPADAFFGRSVSLSGDRALIGTPRDSRIEAQIGSAYTFIRSGSAWSPEATLTASDGAGYDYFGFSVSLSGDRALVGAYGDVSGSAYAFVQSGSTWTQQDKLTASPHGYVSFGTSVSLSGNRALVGMPQASAAGEQSGLAYVFAGIGPVAVEPGVPIGATLSPPVPNPAAGRATLTLSVDRPQTVRATVHDALGRSVAVAFDGLVTDAAQIEVATDRLPAGVYAVRVAGETFVQTRRLTVVR